MSDGEYYNRNARSFSDSTLDLDVSGLYKPFLQRLPAGAKILDAGCGSGRDLRSFASLGYEAFGIDGSPEMVELASENSGCGVALLQFQNVEFVDEFDGIWACASLLHVPQVEMADVLKRFAAALRADGVLYASFKYGDDEVFRSGRHFNNFDESKLARTLSLVPELEVIESWITDDVRPGRENERWLNVLVGKVGSQRQSF